MRLTTSRSRRWRFWWTARRSEGTTRPRPTRSPGTAMALRTAAIRSAAPRTPQSDSTAAGGQKMSTPDNGVANTTAPLANPTDYVEATFTAPAATTYTVWLRLRALNDNKYNDAVWVQFSDARAAGSTAYQINSTSGLL